MEWLIALSIVCGCWIVGQSIENGVESVIAAIKELDAE